MDSLLAVLLVIAALACCWLFYRFRPKPHPLFKQNGIPGPPGVPFFGNFFQVKRAGWAYFDKLLVKQYGPVVGVYLGAKPMVVIADPALLKQVFISKASLFPDREVVPDFFTTAVGLPPGLFVSRGEEWKRARVAIAPAFSTINIRMVAGNIIGVCERLADDVAAHADTNRSIRIDKMFAEYVIESTLALIFGEMDDSAQDAAVLTEACQMLWTTFDQNTVPLLWLLLSQFPWMGVLLGMASKLSWRGRYFAAMHKACTRMVQKQAYKKKKAIVQLMMGCSVPENGHTRKMSFDEVVTQVITFLMAGYETTSVVLGYVAYHLALHQEVQDKLYDHITAYYSSNQDASLLSGAQEIEYLNMVVQESLRIFPPVIGILRHTWEGAELEGVTIPPNTSVFAPVQIMHQNPEFWPQPESFIPERFGPQEKASSSRPECSYMPFGAGQRNCIAARFAMLEVKMMLLQILRSCKFVPGPETQVPLETVYRLLLIPTNGIFLRVQSRQ